MIQVSSQFSPGPEALSSDEKGRETIAICGLNRELLVYDRKKLVDYYQKKLREMIKPIVEQKRGGKFQEKEYENALKRILNAMLVHLEKKGGPENNFSALRWSMRKNFEHFFLDSNPAISRLQRMIFKKYLQSI